MEPHLGETHDRGSFLLDSLEGLAMSGNPLSGFFSLDSKIVGSIKSIAGHDQFDSRPHCLLPLFSELGSKFWIVLFNRLA